MTGRMNGKSSSNLGLVGGRPQGSIIGQLLYILPGTDVSISISMSIVSVTQSKV